MSVDNFAVSAPIAVPARNWDGIQFRLIFAIAFIFHLAAAVGLRLTAGYWRDGRSHRSIFSEAWSASGTTAQMAFSG